MPGGNDREPFRAVEQHRIIAGRYAVRHRGRAFMVSGCPLVDSVSSRVRNNDSKHYEQLDSETRCTRSLRAQCACLPMTSTLVEVRSLAKPEVLVEIETVAYLGKN
jgi:hypothetical protein